MFLLKTRLMIIMTRFKQLGIKGVLLIVFIVSVILMTLQVKWITGHRRSSKRTFNENNDDSDGALTCLDPSAVDYDRVEDIFCTKMPNFLPHLKNPCFYEFNTTGSRRLRCLPYFYIIGMDKSGSTDLHSRLIRHPVVYENLGIVGKESQFWSWSRYGIMHKWNNYTKVTLNSYIDLFNNVAEKIEKYNDWQIITGDASPMDLWDFRGWPLSPQNNGLNEPKVLTPHLLKYVYKHPPKMIILLREPIERLYSDYVFLNYGNNSVDFHHHVLEAIDLIDNCLSNNTRRFCFFDFDLYSKLPARVHIGCYSVFLKEWLSVFPRSAFYIIRTTEYSKNMETILEDMFQFLGISSVSKCLMASIVNRSRRYVTANKKGHVLQRTKKVLRRFYAQCNQELAELLKDERYLWLDHYS